MSPVSTSSEFVTPAPESRGIVRAETIEIRGVNPGTAARQDNPRLISEMPVDVANSIAISKELVIELERAQQNSDGINKIMKIEGERTRLFLRLKRWNGPWGMFLLK
jgi:hypothetical protein